MEYDVTAATGLARPDMQGTSVRVEDADLERSKLPKTTPREQRRLNEVSEISVSGINQPAALVDTQISDARRISFLEGFNSSPSIIRRNLSLTPGAVERRLQDRQDAVRRSATAPTLLLVIFIYAAVLLAVTLPGAQSGCSGRGIGEPFA